MNILLIDDDPDTRREIADYLKKNGHILTTASNGKQGLRHYHLYKPELIITDIVMPEMNGLELLRRIKNIEKSPVGVIMITGGDSVNSAIKSLKYGAYDYFKKPIDLRELYATIERYSEYKDILDKYLRLKERFGKRVDVEKHVPQHEPERLSEAYMKDVGLDNFCVYSEEMRNVLNLAQKFSTDRSIPVLIEGESGTGKELVAKYINYYGAGGADSPFVDVNCGAVSPKLFEGELFGHEAGAYTGATSTGRMGKLELANGGTIFLDEIGETPFNLQVKLLRALEERMFYRVGGIKKINIDIRVITATNKNLKHEVKNNRFRLDLFYRINLGTIRIPPLRERRDDILPLAFRFASRASARKEKIFGGFTSSAEDFLKNYSWPGNVRQLKNTMELLAFMGPWDLVDRKDLSFIDDTFPEDSPKSSTIPVLGADPFLLPESSLDIELLNYKIIGEALKKFNGNQTMTAQYLGISRRVLQGKLKNMPDELIPVI